jgi:suppressor for copper-sensitivity B
MLLLGVLGGLILNAMPCVLPVLSLKVFGLVKSAGQGRGEVTRGALATSAGILVSFWALALLAIVARSGGKAVGWGIQFQEPTFVAALTLVVVLFCLNLWGVFEVTLPGRLVSLGDASGRRGLAGHFTTGLFATLMATPCSAPFLGTAIGFGLSQSAGTILAIFSAVGLGMAVPYLALAIAPGSARHLPRPGAWMGHLRTAMGFLLAGAAVWLLYVLSSQVSAERLAFFEGALLLVALLVWWRQTVTRPAVRRVAALAALVVMVLGLAIARGGGSAENARVADRAGLIAWRPFDRGAAERLAGEGSLVFVDVTADWCFTCKVNERLALETDAVAESFARHEVVAMKADWTNRSDEIARFLSDHGRYGIPFYLLYRPGREPHLFGELITSQEIVGVVDEAAQSQLSSFRDRGGTD